MINKNNKISIIVFNYNSIFKNNINKLYILYENISSYFNMNLLSLKLIPILYCFEKEDYFKNSLNENIKKIYSEKILFYKDKFSLKEKNDNVKSNSLIKEQKSIVQNFRKEKKIFIIRKSLNKLIYNYMFFKFKIKFNDNLVLLKINNIENFSIEKNRQLLPDKKEKIKEEKKIKDFILDKKLFNQYPPKIPLLYNKKYIFGNDTIPNVFYNHLIINNKNLKNKKPTFIKCAATKRFKGKKLTLLYYHPISKN